ncbi:MAG: MerR family transcriptional regulator [Clostridiaceae bacterium]|nr:MerR family transcriptional regulator [Clostridiaceae bacterium]
MGVTTESLRHYQKYSILEPKKDKDSTYKYYDPISVGRLLAMRKMRTAGYSLADISKNMTEFSVQEYYRTFYENTQSAKRKLEYQKILIERMECHLKFVEKLFNEDFSFEIEKSPDYYCFDYMVGNNLILQEQPYLKQFARWSEYMLFVLNYSPCSFDILDEGINEIKIGLLAEEKFVNFFDLDTTGLVYKRESKLCVTCPIRHNLHGKLIGKIKLQDIQEYLWQNNLTPTGEPFFVGEVSFHQKGEEFFYSKLYIPIE